MQYSSITLFLAFAATAFAQGQQADGQVTQVSAATQISDGQIQVPTAVPSVTQISDGQVQVPTVAPTTAAGVAQISDGQIQASATGAPAPSANGTFTSPAPSAFTGGASFASWSKEVAVAAVGAAAGFALL